MTAVISMALPKNGAPDVPRSPSVHPRVRHVGVRCLFAESDWSHSDLSTDGQRSEAGAAEGVRGWHVRLDQPVVEVLTVRPVEGPSDHVSSERITARLL